MTRPVIPIRSRLPQVAKAETAGDHKTSALIGTVLILLHIASLTLALTYF